MNILYVCKCVTILIIYILIYQCNYIMSGVVKMDISCVALKNFVFEVVSNVEVNVYVS